ncbi:MAG: sulfite exporter TauE/SafE family protein [Pseudomonadota bacterium]
MIETLQAIPGLPVIALAVLAAGLVYGFAGFGAALIVMPLATIYLDPLIVIAAFSLSALSSLVTVVPGALRDAHIPAVSTMVLTSWLGIPLGLFLLTSVDVTAVRWAVSAIVAGTLVTLIAGWRYQGSPGPRAWVGIGGLVGVMGGSTGLNGPALALFQLSGPDGAAQSRANTIVVLTLNSLAMMPLMALQGLLTREALVLGAALFPVYACGTWVGKQLFNPARVGLYRRTAYTIIAAAAVVGLPIWN